jgi:hypothetical protein
MSAGEFIPGSAPDRDCTDRAAYGTGSTLDSYIVKTVLPPEDEFPSDVCPPKYHSRAKIDILNVKSNGGGHVLSNKKNLPFDMPHPNKEGWRLRHVCIEGPEIAVYFRGRVKNREEISYPSYWKGLVDWTTVTVNLTPIGAHQNVIVKRFDEDKIYLQSKGGMPIDCFYHVTARRLDDDLVVEYEGQSHEDYPGGNEGYSFNFEHNYVKGLIEKFVKENLDTGS